MNTFVAVLGLMVATVACVFAGLDIAIDYFSLRPNTQRLIVNVPATAGWQTIDNFWVNAGEAIKIRYMGGSWSPKMGYPDANDVWVGAEGINFPLRYDEIGIEANWGGLLAKIGDAMPVYVGNERILSSNTTGLLQLAMNDIGMGDNAGAITVQIERISP